LKVSNIIKFIASLLIASFLFYIVFRNVSFEEYIGRLDEVSFAWVFLSIALSILSHLLRAYRWNLTLEPLGYKLTTFRTFLSLMVGYLANLALPRLGEVTRCGMLKKNDKVPMSVGIGSVITERLLDFIILLSLIALDFIVEFEMIFDFFLESINWDQYENKGVIFSVVAVVLIIGVVGSIWITRLFLKHDFKNKTLIKAKAMLSTLIEGLLSIRKMKNVTGYVLSTIGIWIFYFLMSYVIFFSMEETAHLGIGAGLSILAGAGVSMAMPVQGGIGAYHAIVSGVLVIYGIDPKTALFFATLLHTSQIIMMLVVGSASFVGSMFISNSKN